MIKANVILENKNWRKHIKSPSDYIKRKFNKLSKIKDFNINKEFSILLTDNKKIKLLNNKFRKKNKPTDILSFPFFNKKNLKKNLKHNKFYLGDIAISDREFLKKNKSDLKNSFIKIFIHGFLHLLNFDHKSDKDYEIMNSVENKIFQKIKG